MRAAAIAVAVLAISGAARAGEADPIVRGVLHEDGYRFCHEKDYPLTPEEHAWCPMVGEENDACPALPEACKLPPASVHEVAELRRVRGAGRTRERVKEGAPDTRKREKTAQREPQRDTRRRPEPEAPVTVPDMSGFAKVLLAALVAAFVIGVGRALAKNFLRERTEDAPPEETPPGAAAPAEAEAPRGPVETDVERLLARARAAAARGDHARAIDDAYAALLRRLDGDGLIDIHPSRTNGDYVRALSGRPDLRRHVRDVVRQVESVQFGSAAPSESISRAVIDRVVPLVSRALAVVIFCVGLGSSLSCAALDEGGEGGPRGDASPSGMQAIADVLRKRSYEVRYRSEAVDALDEPATLVIVPGANVDAEGWTRLLAWARDKGGRVVLAGVEPPEALGVRIAGGAAGDRVHVGWSFDATYGALGLAIPAGAQLVSVKGDEEDVPDVLLQRGESAYAVLHHEGRGLVAAFADDRLFTNAALAVPADALFLDRFFDKMGAPRVVEICDAWTGAGAATPIESVQRARLTPFVVQLFVLLGLLYLWRGRAFARLRDPPAETRRDFADHARALGTAYARARASRHVLGLYAVWAIDRLRERVHGAGRQGLLPLAEAIAARTGRSEAEVMRVLVDASSARDEAAPASSYRPRSVPPPAKGARGDATEADLALLRELEGFLTATGHRRPARRSGNQTA